MQKLQVIVNLPCLGYNIGKRNILLSTFIGFYKGDHELRSRGRNSACYSRKTNILHCEKYRNFT